MSELPGSFAQATALQLERSETEGATVLQDTEMVVPTTSNISLDSCACLRRILHGKTGARKIAAGGEREVFLMENGKWVAKVDHKPADTETVIGRKEFQEICRVYFPTDAVHQEVFAHHENGDRPIAFQRYMNEMENPHRIVVCGGYAERKRFLSPELYAKVSRSAFFQHGMYDRNDFLKVHGNDHMLKLFRALDSDGDFRQKFSELISAVMWFAEDTGHGIDFMGGEITEEQKENGMKSNENVILYPDALGWHYSFCDQRAPVAEKLIPIGKYLCHKFTQGARLNRNEMIHLINFVDFIRIVHSFADELGFDESERIPLDISPRIDFGQFQNQVRSIAA